MPRKNQQRNPRTAHAPKYYSRHKPTTTYWAEPMRMKMSRWKNSGLSGLQLLILGVPLSLMYPHQRRQAAQVTGRRIPI